MPSTRTLQSSHHMTPALYLTALLASPATASSWRRSACAGLRCSRPCCHALSLLRDLAGWWWLVVAGARVGPRWLVVVGGCPRGLIHRARRPRRPSQGLCGPLPNGTNALCVDISATGIGVPAPDTCPCPRMLTRGTEAGGRWDRHDLMRSVVRPCRPRLRPVWHVLPRTRLLSHERHPHGRDLPAGQRP
jgi:hypothetical protein